MKEFSLPKSCIYVGNVMHARLAPKPHKFRYGVFSLFLDLDKVEQGILPSFLKIDKWGVVSFYRKDHGSRDGTNLKCWANQELEKKMLNPAEKIFLLSFPRIFGFGFSPLSIFFCYRDKNIFAVIYEVKNTIGDQVAYTLPIEKVSKEIIFQEHRKEMYVSPFIEMNQVYNFIIKTPGKNLCLKIKQSGSGVKTLIATHNARRVTLSNKNLLKSLLTHPLMGIKILVGIHWEAIRLFLKGIKTVSYKA